MLLHPQDTLWTIPLQYQITEKYSLWPQEVSILWVETKYPSVSEKCYPTDNIYACVGLFKNVWHESHKLTTKKLTIFVLKLLHRGSYKSLFVLWYNITEELFTFLFSTGQVPLTFSEPDMNKCCSFSWSALARQITISASVLFVSHFNSWLQLWYPQHKLGQIYELL